MNSCLKFFLFFKQFFSIKNTTRNSVVYIFSMTLSVFDNLSNFYIKINLYNLIKKLSINLYCFIIFVVIYILELMKYFLCWKRKIERADSCSTIMGTWSLVKQLWNYWKFFVSSNEKLYKLIRGFLSLSSAK